MRRYLIWIVSISLFCIAETAHAGAALWIDGPSADGLTQRLRQRVPGLQNAVPDSEFGAKLTEAGVPKAVATVLQDLIYNKDSRGLQAAARAVGAEAVVIGITRRQGHTVQLQWAILDTATGDLLGTGTDTVLRKKKRASTWQTALCEREIGKALSVASPLALPKQAASPAGNVARASPSANRTAGAGDRTIEATPTDTNSDRDVGQTLVTQNESESLLADSAIEAQVGYAIAGRDVGFQGVSGPGLHPYQVLGAHGLQARLRLFPGAFATTEGVLPVGGLEGRYDEYFGVRSGFAGQTETFGTTWRSFYAGAATRFDLRPLVLGLGVGYGQTLFTFAGLGATAPSHLMPEASYQNIEASLRLSLDLDPLTIDTHLAYQHLLDTGNLSIVFPKGSAFGFRGELTVGVRIVAGFEARLAATYNLVIHDLKPQASDPWQASGAMDHMFSAGARLVYVL
jgi:hypothetical protein